VDTLDNQGLSSEFAEGQYRGKTR